MKLTKKTIENKDVYFENGVKKYAYYKDSDGGESWREFDKNNNVIHFKNSDGYETWEEYDKNNKQIHYKNSYGYEYWEEYDKNNNVIHYKDSSGYETWSDDNPKNPNYIGVEVDIEPFTFNTEE